MHRSAEPLPLTNRKRGTDVGTVDGMSKPWTFMQRAGRAAQEPRRRNTEVPDTAASRNQPA